MKPTKIKTLVNIRAKNKKYGIKRICWNSANWKRKLSDMTEVFDVLQNTKVGKGVVLHEFIFLPNAHTAEQRLEIIDNLMRKYDL